MGSIDMNPGDESRTHVEWHRKGWSRSGLNAMRKASGSTVPTANDAADITLPLSQRRLFRSSCSSGVSAERPRTPNASGALPALARKHQLPARAQSVLGSSLPARPGTAASAACSIFSDSPQPQITGLGTHAIAATLVPRAKSALGSAVPLSERSNVREDAEPLPAGSSSHGVFADAAAPLAVGTASLTSGNRTTPRRGRYLAALRN